MTTLYKYRIYCNTENAWVSAWYETDTAPSVCPNNNTHDVNLNSTQLLQTSGDTIVTIKEEATPTGGYFACKTVDIDIPSGTTGSITITDSSFPIPISMLNISFSTNGVHTGDGLEVHVAPNTIIGSLTANLDSGTTGGVTGFDVSQTVVDNLKIGFWVDVYNGVTSHDLGRCTMVDKNNKRITTEKSAPIDYLASSPTYIRQTVKMMHDYTFGEPGTFTVGAYKIGGSYVPTGKIGRVKYINNSGNAKEFRFQIEYLY